MLISYLGIDFQCKSERVYRLLDTTLTFYGVAKEGETLCYDIQINSFAKQEGQVQHNHLACCNTTTPPCKPHTRTR